MRLSLGLCPPLSDPPEVWVRFFGFMSTHWDGLAAISLSPKERQLFALLVLNTGRAVSVGDEIAAELWPDGIGRPGAVQTYVGRLREYLGDRGRQIVRTGDESSYYMDIDPDKVDVLLFQKLLCRVRGALAERKFGETLQIAELALALVRGDCFANIPQVGPLADWRVKIRLSIEEMLTHYYRAALVQRHHQLVQVRLHQLWQESKRREDIARLAMIALALCGRWEEALDIFAATKEVLDKAPGPQLLEVQALVLLKTQAALDTLRLIVA